MPLCMLMQTRRDVGVWQDRALRPQLMFDRSLPAMDDRTVYANEDATPKLNLRQIFGRQGLHTNLCRLWVDKGLLTVEMFAMLGQDLTSAKDPAEIAGGRHDPARG